MKNVFAVIVVISLGYTLFGTAMLGVRIFTGRELSDKSVPFQNAASPERYKILIVGDSTGVGTGAESPEDSIAGLILRDFPETTIENRAENGAKFADVVTQLDDGTMEQYDLILIQAGGNDILRFTSLDTLGDNVETLLRTAKGRARHVVFMSTGNVGNAPAFRPPLSWVYTSRTRKVRKLLMEIAETEGVYYVDLFMERSDDPFVAEPDRYNAPDFLHPGSEGYRLWYEALKTQTGLDELLQEEPIE